MHCEANSSPTLRNMIFLNNTALYGAALMAIGGSSPTVIGCLFKGNYGAGTVDIRDNSTASFYKTVFDSNDGGCLEGWDSNLSVVNCTFYDCGAPVTFWTNGTYVIENSIFAFGHEDPDYDWSASIYTMDDATVEISYTDIFENASGDWVDGNWSGDMIADQYGINGNVSLDPLFVDAENGNLRLQDDSPCLNTGNPDSQDDPDGSQANMGAF